LATQKLRPCLYLRNKDFDGAVKVFSKKDTLLLKENNRTPKIVNGVPQTYPIQSKRVKATKMFPHAEDMNGLPRKKIMQNKIIPGGEIINPDFVSSFTAEFDREIMITDRMRAFLICGLSLFAVLWFIFAGLFLSNKLPYISLKIFHNKNMYFWLIIVFAGLAVYELLYALVLTLFLKKKKTFLMVQRFLNALVEISIPTIMVYLSFNVFDSIIKMDSGVGIGIN